MEIYNNTGSEVVYNISSSTIDDSGTLSPGQTSDDEPAYDNQQNATVSFTTTSGNTFEVIIPESKAGMTVTVGIYFE